MKREGAETSYVELYIDDSIRIRRYCNDIKYNNKIELTINDEEIALHTINEYQKVINDIVKITYEHFITSVVIAQGLPVSLLQMSPTKRNDYFISLLPINFFNLIKFIKKDILVITDRIDKIKNNITKIKMELSKRKGYLEAYSKITKDIDNLKEYKSEYLNKVEFYDNEKGNIQYKQKSLSELNINFNSSSKMASLLKEVIDKGKCPVCNHIVSDSNKEEYNKYVNKSRSTHKSIQSLKAEIESSQLKNSELLHKIEQLDYKIKEVNKYSEDIDSSDNNDIDKFSSAIKVMEDSLLFIQDDYSKLAELQALLLPSGEVRSILIARYVSIFNDILKSITKSIWNDSFTCKVMLDSEGLKFTTNKPFSLSGGEQRLFNVVIQLAFVEFIGVLNNIKINLLVFDETFDGMDITSVFNFINYLKETVDNMSVYVITHDSQIKSLFDKVLTIKKKDKISYIGGISE